MTLDNDNNLKNTKNNIVSNSKNEDLIDVDSDNFNLEHFDEKLYGEVQFISNALKNDSLNLTPKEESKLKQDLDLILLTMKKQNQEYNYPEKSDDERININESKYLDFDDNSIFVRSMDADSSSSRSFEDNFLFDGDGVVPRHEGYSFHNSLDGDSVSVDDADESVVADVGAVSVDDADESVVADVGAVLRMSLWLLMWVLFLLMMRMSLWLLMWVLFLLMML